MLFILFIKMDPILQLSKENLIKYKTAGKIISIVLDKIIKKCICGSNIIDLCNYGDQLILDELNKVYKKSYKGLSIPTNICKNNIAGNYLVDNYNDSNNKLYDGDLIKIELGCHIDEFPAIIVYSYLIGNSNNLKLKTLIESVSLCSKEIMKIMIPGTLNTEIPKILKLYSENNKLNLLSANSSEFMPGILSCQISKGIIDGNNDDDVEYIHRFILNKNNDNYEFGMKSNKLEEDEVYTIDVAMSTGTGKLRKCDNNTFIYRKNQSVKSNLKLKASKEVLNKFKKNKFPISFYNDKSPKTKIGLKDCVNKNLIIPYLPMEEKKDDIIVRSKFTIIVNKNPILITGKSLDKQLERIN